MFNKKLFLIFVLALFLRLIFLSSTPFGFHNDEVDVGYIGKFVLKYGYETTGNSLPLTFNKFGDFRPTGIFYLSGISQLILGSSEFSVRLPAALFGALSVFPLFLLVKELFKKEQIAYLSAAFLAIVPWHIVLSRATHEVIIGYFFVLFGVYYFVKYLDFKKRKFLIYSAIFIVFSYLFYHGIRIMVPLLFISFLPLLRFKKAYLFVFGIIAFTVILLLSPIGSGRGSQVIFYKNPGIVKKLENLSFADSNIYVARTFHNKFVVYSRELTGNYLQYFSADFLVLGGGYPERYRVSEVGVFYIVLLLPLVYGFTFLLKKKSGAQVVLLWLIVSPIPAVLTYEDIPSVTRASFMIFPLVIISGFGAYNLYQNIRSKVFRRFLTLIFLLILVLEIVFFFHQYFFHQRLSKGILRDEGTKETVQYIYKNKDNYDLVVAQYGTSLPVYFLFFNNIYDKDIRLDLSSSRDFGYSNVVFTKEGCPSHRRDHYEGLKVLYIDEPNCTRKPGFEEIFSVKRLDSTIAYVALVEIEEEDN